MRNIDENTITTAILERTKDGDNRGLKEVPGALIRPALDFDGEARPTESARLAGIEFLTATGHKCDDKRQESLLLFDPLGESTLTVALNDANPREYAKCPLLGFFQVDVASRFELGVDISGGASRAPLFVSAHVRTADGTPVCDAGTSGKLARSGYTTSSRRTPNIFMHVPSRAAMMRATSAYGLCCRFTMPSRQTARLVGCYWPPGVTHGAWLPSIS